MSRESMAPTFRVGASASDSDDAYLIYCRVGFQDSTPVDLEVEVPMLFSFRG